MKFDLHMHSCNSYDSFSSVEKIVKRAKNQGLNGIAITDHEKVLNDEYIDCYTDSDFWLIKAGEFQTEIGDIVGLFLSDSLRQQNARELIQEIHGQGGLAILAHPFKRIHPEYPEEILNMLDAVEVANARSRDLNLLSHNPKVKRLLTQVEGRTAGSDAHFLFEIGRAYLATPGLAHPNDLKKIICSGTGEVFYRPSSDWLEILSQGVKFIKRPTIKQFLRLFYYSGKNITSFHKRDAFE